MRARASADAMSFRSIAPSYVGVVDRASIIDLIQRLSHLVEAPRAVICRLARDECSMPAV
ncbi:MAG: hypothetical protein WA418_36785 [Bradyrhizobium sp.]